MNSYMCIHIMCMYIYIYIYTCIMIMRPGRPPAAGLAEI